MELLVKYLDEQRSSLAYASWKFSGTQSVGSLPCDVSWDNGIATDTLFRYKDIKYIRTSGKQALPFSPSRGASIASECELGGGEHNLQFYISYKCLSSLRLGDRWEKLAPTLG